MALREGPGVEAGPILEAKSEITLGKFKREMKKFSNVTRPVEHDDEVGIRGDHGVVRKLRFIPEKIFVSQKKAR